MNRLISLVSAVNDDSVLRACLLKSPNIEADFELLLQRGYRSAAAAYNSALECAGSEIVIFVHQDVFLPAGWKERLLDALDWLTKKDSNWGVLGLYGVAKDGAHRGWVYSAGLSKMLGDSFAVPQVVRTLDEVLLVVRKASGIRFDENLEGFHMYGTDICLEAERLGFQNYVIPCFAIHNSNGIKYLPFPFWRAFFFMRRKWYRCLPVSSPCVTITRFPLKAVVQLCREIVQFGVRRKSVGRRVADVESLFSLIMKC